MRHFIRWPISVAPLIASRGEGCRPAFRPHPPTRGGALARVNRQQILASDPTTARINWGYRSGLVIGQSYGFTVDIGWPQTELGPFASTPVLPSRGADVIAATLGSLGITSSGAGTLLFAGMIAQAAPSDRDQTILQIAC